MFSLSLDYDREKDVTVSGYASQWGWSRKKVSNFLKRVGVEILYPEKTSKKQNQKGQIGLQIGDRSGTDKEQIRVIDSKWMDDNKNRSGTDKEQIRNRSGSTTINPNPNPNPNPKKLFPENSDEFRLANFLLNYIKANKPDFKQPNLQSWAKTADLMIRVDERSVESIKSVIMWSQADDFWSGNILSMTKLRKQFDALEIRMKKPKPKQRTEKRERSLAELKAAAIYHEDGTISLRD